MQKQNIFKTVKQHVMTRQAASFYGLKVNENGMCCCPFHPDKTPSMKVDTRYHCFGCGADGDVINFVQRMFGLNPKEAVLKLADVFGIPISKGQSQHRGTGPPARKKEEVYHTQGLQSPDNGIQQWLSKAIRTLTDYYRQLRDWKKTYAPKDPEENWHPRFCEAIQSESKIEYYLDILMFGSKKEQTDFYKNARKVVNIIERRLYEYSKQEWFGRITGSEKSDSDQRNNCSDPITG